MKIKISLLQKEFFSSAIDEEDAIIELMEEISWNPQEWIFCEKIK